MKKKNLKDLTTRNAKHYNKEMKLLWDHIFNIRQLHNDLAKIHGERLGKLEEQLKKINAYFFNYFVRGKKK